MGLCVHATPSSPVAPMTDSKGMVRAKGCCRGGGALTAHRSPPRGGMGSVGSVCLGADPIRCRLGHKEMPECWESPAEGHRGGPDPIEIIRLWREGVYVTTVRG